MIKNIIGDGVMYKKMSFGHKIDLKLQHEQYHETVCIDILKGGIKVAGYTFDEERSNYIYTPTILKIRRSLTRSQKYKVCTCSNIPLWSALAPPSLALGGNSS